MIKSGQNAFKIKTEPFVFFEQNTTKKYALKLSAPHILPLQKQSDIAENKILFRFLDCEKKQKEQTVAVNLLLTRYRNGVHTNTVSNTSPDITLCG